MKEMCAECMEEKEIKDGNWLCEECDKKTRKEMPDGCPFQTDLYRKKRCYCSHKPCKIKNKCILSKRYIIYKIRREL